MTPPVAFSPSTDLAASNVENNFLFLSLTAERQNLWKRLKFANVWRVFQLRFSGTISIWQFFCVCRLCQACRRPFNDPAVARYPNGVTTHIHCARNKTVCPVTGHVFSSLEQTNDVPKDEWIWPSLYPGRGYGSNADGVFQKDLH